MLEEAIKYRTEKYGCFEGFGNPKANKHPPKHYAKSTSFMGMHVQVHEKIHPRAQVRRGRAQGGHSGERIQAASDGRHARSTTRTRACEVSNHVCRIAIDIEPDKNTCCGCVAPWNAHPLCKQKGKSVWERMVMPRSWVETFEKYGFYWLGHDVLQDTMHFEFLGDPDKITGGAHERRRELMTPREAGEGARGAKPLECEARSYSGGAGRGGSPFRSRHASRSRTWSPATARPSSSPSTIARSSVLLPRTSRTVVRPPATRAA